MTIHPFQRWTMPLMSTWQNRLMATGVVCSVEPLPTRNPTLELTLSQSTWRLMVGNANCAISTVPVEMPTMSISADITNKNLPKIICFVIKPLQLTVFRTYHGCAVALLQGGGGRRRSGLPVQCMWTLQQISAEHGKPCGSETCADRRLAMPPLSQSVSQQKCIQCPFQSPSQTKDLPSHAHVDRDSICSE